MREILLLGFILVILAFCKKDDNIDLKLIDSIELHIGDCISTIEKATICFDSLLNDSRCPEGGICVWAGNANITLDLTLKNGNKNIIELNTNSAFPIDTTIDYLYLLLTKLTPYPEISMMIKPEDYKAKLTIANIDKLESNAILLGFNHEKCGCCWGWTIKVGNDTIKSDDIIIGKTIGYGIDYPVNVYIELGELEQNCKDVVGMDYYDIKQIIKTK